MEQSSVQLNAQNNNYIKKMQISKSVTDPALKVIKALVIFDN